MAPLGFFDYVNHDLPAALQLIREVSDSEYVHGIGHSLGGLVLMAGNAQGAELTSLVTIGSALDYSETPSVFHRAARLAWLESNSATHPDRKFQPQPGSYCLGIRQPDRPV